MELLWEALDCWYELQKRALDRPSKYENLHKKDFAFFRSTLFELDTNLKRAAEYRAVSNLARFHYYVCCKLEIHFILDKKFEHGLTHSQ